MSAGGQFEYELEVKTKFENTAAQQDRTLLHIRNDQLKRGRCATIVSRSETKAKRGALTLMDFRMGPELLGSREGLCATLVITPEGFGARKTMY